MSSRRQAIRPPTASLATGRRRSLAGKLVLAVRGVYRAAIDCVRYCRRRPRFPVRRLDYDDYWDLRTEVPLGSRFTVMADLVRPGARVLDVGCGEGTLLAHLVETRGVEAIGIDLSARAVERARARGLDAIAGDVTRGALPRGPFDHVLCGELLEHIPEPEQVLLALREISVGTLILSVPNVGYYPDRCRLLAGRFPVQWLDHPAEHLRFFTVKDFRDWARDLGFRIRSIHAASGFPILMNGWPNLFAQQVVYELEVQR